MWEVREKEETKMTFMFLAWTDGVTVYEIGRYKYKDEEAGFGHG